MACPDCFRGGRVTGKPKGTIQSLYGVPTYIAGAQDTSPSDSTIIYFTDAFGLSLVNNKVLADAYASATGLRVLVPDIIPGGPVPASALDTMDAIMKPIAIFDLYGQVKRLLAVFTAVYHFVPFMYRARPTIPANIETCLTYARNVKADLTAGGKLGKAGFCWGGYFATNLCTETAVEGGEERLVDAAFTAHPSFLNAPDDIVQAVLKHKTPLSVAHAEHDVMMSTEKVEEAEAVLRQKAGSGDGENGYHYQVKIYKGVSHGFAVRAKQGDEGEGKAADGAKEQAVRWFKTWL